MTDAPLPCPFCFIEPLARDYLGVVMCRCTTPDCPAIGSSHTLPKWNTRAPVAAPDPTNERHPHADVARLCIVNARLELIGLCISADQEPSVRRFERWLQKALDALRPPAAPVSVAFWLGREA